MFRLRIKTTDWAASHNLYTIGDTGFYFAFWSWVLQERRPSIVYMEPKQ